MPFWRTVGETHGARVDVDGWGMDDRKGSLVALCLSLSVSGVQARAMPPEKSPPATAAQPFEAAALSPGEDVFGAGLRVLLAPCAFEKAHLTLAAVRAYQEKRLHLPSPLPLPREEVDSRLPAMPARPPHPSSSSTSNPSNSSQKLPKKGVAVSIHGIAHAESWAIDLMWDLMLRFAYDSHAAEASFWDDFLEIAKQEAEHFLSWAIRLEEGYGLRYGCLSGTDTLWASAEASKDDVMARLSLINLVQEARGLDTSELTLRRLLRAGDEASADTLRKNAKEEEGHVAAGIKWFGFLKDARHLEGSPESVFHAYVKDRHKGVILPPFNDEARRRAGMRDEWYLPLVTPKKEGGREVACEEMKQTT